MKRLVPVFIGFVLSGLNLACSMSVREAQAPTNPPQVEKSLFSMSQIEGSFKGGTTLMFKWPVSIWDENSESFVPMTYSQEVNSRADIVRYSEEKDIYEALYIEAATALELKYAKLTDDLVTEYKDLKCFSMCDPADFPFCDPEDSDVLFQDSWKPTEDPEELALIATCQENEEERRGIDAQKDQEAEEKVIPLRDKAGAAALNLLEAVGDRNFFNNLSSFEMAYFFCEQGMKGECEGKVPGTEVFLIKVAFAEGYFTNQEDGKALGQVSDVRIDKDNGFLTFTIPGLDFGNDLKPYGKIHFDLELNPNGEQLSVNGDIQVENTDTQETRIGRFSSSGTLNKKVDPTSIFTE